MMDDLASKLTEFMSNSGNLESLKGLSGLFEKKDQLTGEVPKPPVQEQSPFGTDMMQKAMKIIPLLSSTNKEDESTRFLLALKPLLSEKRRKRIDESIKMLHVIRLMPLLKSQELFS